MPNSFTLSINNSPAQVYMMSHTLMTVEYQGSKFLLMLDLNKSCWHCSIKLKEVEKITEMIERHFINLE